MIRICQHMEQMQRHIWCTNVHKGDSRDIHFYDYTLAIKASYNDSIWTKHTKLFNEVKEREEKWLPKTLVGSLGVEICFVFPAIERRGGWSKVEEKRNRGILGPHHVLTSESTHPIFTIQ